MDTVRALYVRLRRIREQLGSPRGPVQPSADYSPGGHVARCSESPLHLRLAELACVLRRARVTPEEDEALSARCEVEMRPRERSGEGSAVDVVALINIRRADRKIAALHEIGSRYQEQIDEAVQERKRERLRRERAAEMESVERSAAFAAWSVRYYRGTLAVAEDKLRRELARGRGR